jgi:hypothetical protein
MAYGTLNAGTITPGSGNTLTINETVTHTGAVTLPSPVINTGVSGSAISTSASLGTSDTLISSQAAIKSYVDSAGTNSSITTLGTVTSGNFDTIFPFTSNAQNFGKMRIVCGQVTSGSSASSGTISPFVYYLPVSVSYSGFASIISVHMDVQLAAANVRTAGIHSWSTTQAGGYLTSPTASDVQSIVCMFTIIGVAS